MVKPAALAFCALLACGVEVVELAPHDVLVLGDVPGDAIAELAASEGMPDPKLLLEPAEGAALPANVAPIRFAWDAKPMSIFELRVGSLRVYTTESSVTLPAERWRALLRGTELRVELRALEAKGKRMVRRSEPRTLTIGPPLEGTLFFTSATQAERASIAESSAQATDELARARGAVYGGRVAQVGPSRIELADRTLPVEAGARIAHPSWSPDGSTLVFTYWPASLQLADAPSDDHEGSVLAQLTLEGSFRALDIQGAMNPRRPRFTPSGLIFEAGKLDDPQLFVVAREGGMARRVMCEGAMKASAPAWLADSWFAFVSTREPPRGQIWITSLDDTRCSAPFWFPAQDAQRDYQALWFER